MEKIVNSARDFLIYRVMEPADFEPVLEMLADTFSANSPLDVALGITEQEFRDMAEFEMQAMVAQRLSIVAEDTRDGTIAGAMVAHDAHSPEPEGVSPAVPKYRPIAELVNPMNEACLEKFAHLKGKLLYYFALGVRPEYQGCGVAKKVTWGVVNQAAKLGYELSYCISTSIKATEALLRLGFDITEEILYEDYVLNGEKPFLAAVGKGSAVIMTCKCVPA